MEKRERDGWMGLTFLLLMPVAIGTTCLLLAIAYFVAFKAHDCLQTAHNTIEVKR